MNTIPQNIDRETLMQTTCPLAPVRRGKLGESRVLKPFPLDEVIIVGMGATAVQFINHCFEVGYSADGVKSQVWAINNAAHAFNCDLAWSVHDGPMMKLDRFKKGGKFYLSDLKVPLVLAEALEEYPTSVEYPLAEVFAAFNETYFNNTTAYMIAFAMLCGVKTIRMFGTDYNYNGHRVFENGRPCTEYWLGRARERGIEVFVTPNGNLMDASLRKSDGVYGYTLQPLAELDADGKVCGIKDFVDPFEYKLNVQLLKKVANAAGFTDEHAMEKAERTLSIFTNTFGLNQIEMMALLDGSACVRPKDA